MLVYRLEKNGVGPYQSFRWNCFDAETKQFLKMIAESHEDSNHPSFMLDVYPGECKPQRQEYFAGCSSLEQLEEWFEGYLTFLLSIGFSIVTYKAVDYVTGRSGKQVFFRKSTAEKME